MNRVLIIGGDGFIGRNILEELIESDFLVFCLSRNGKLINKDEYNKVKFYQGNLEDTSLIEDIIDKNKVDTVIHLASSLIPSSSVNDYYNELSNIILPTFKIIDLVEGLGVKFIFYSSGGAVYGQSSSVDVINEDFKKKPINYYGYSKLQIENYIQFVARRGKLKYIIFRPSNVYGKYQNIERPQGFIGTAINKIFNGEDLFVYGNGEVYRDYIYVEDLVKVCIDVVCKTTENEIFNISSGEVCSLNEILHYISTHISLEQKVSYKGPREFDMPIVKLSNKKVSKKINYSFKSVSQGIKNYIDWLEGINE